MNNILFEEKTINNFRFPGQYFIEETGLYYNWWRWYEKELGYYLQADLIDTDLIKYIYVKSNPINRIDIKGLFCQPGCALRYIGDEAKLTIEKYCCDIVEVPVHSISCPPPHRTKLLYCQYEVTKTYLWEVKVYQCDDLPGFSGCCKNKEIYKFTNKLLNVDTFYDLVDYCIDRGCYTGDEPPSTWS